MAVFTRMDELFIAPLIPSRAKYPRDCDTLCDLDCRHDVLRADFDRETDAAFAAPDC